MTIKIKQIGACAVLAALMMAGAWLNTACSSDETIVDNKPAVGVNTTPTETTVKFTATLAPKGDNASGTRAITTGTDGGKEILNVKWKIDEKIAIYYQKTDDSYAMAKATVGEPNTDGSAPITATLTNAKGGTATFIYPYSLATNDGKIDTSIDSKFRTQDGTIDYISTYLDAATTTGTIDVSGGTATISGRIKMENQVCICKLDFDLIVDPNDGANYYNVFVDVKKDGTTNSFVANNVPKASMGAVYMAILGTTGAECKFRIYGNDNNTSTSTRKSYYEKKYTNVTLEAGKFYRSVSIVNNIDLSKLTEDYIAKYGDVLTGRLDTKLKLSIADGASVKLKNVTINNYNDNGAGIECLGNATIFLEGNNIVCSINGCGVQAGPPNKTLTISGSGEITATGGTNAAGIGSGKGESCGNIAISGGTVTASGKDYAAGIGCGSSGSCGNITITKDVTKVTATGGSRNDYSIGKGFGSSCGTITIGGTKYYDGSNWTSESLEDALKVSPFIYQPSH